MYEPSYFLPSDTHFTERESRKSNALAYKAQQFSDDSRNLSVIIYLSTYFTMFLGFIANLSTIFWTHNLTRILLNQLTFSRKSTIIYGSKPGKEFTVGVHLTVRLTLMCWFNVIRSGIIDHRSATLMSNKTWIRRWSFQTLFLSGQDYCFSCCALIFEFCKSTFPGAKTFFIIVRAVIFF